MRLSFELQHRDKKARAGRITTAHSVIETPVFMPVGTNATVKSLDFADLENLDAKIILANTYHLYLRDAYKVIKNIGGLHQFSGFRRSFLTDSGGFQAFSLKGKKLENGILFKSHIDGSSHIFTPKMVLDIQYALNSDIMMVLDDLIGLPAPKNEILKALHNTTKWAKESLDYHIAQRSERELTNNIFAIVQGGDYADLRELSAKALQEVGDFDGFAIGGLAVGESAEQMYEAIEACISHLPQNKPRYLMGVGTPENLIEAINLGVDMFDCVMPSRNARNGSIFTKFGRLNIKNQRFKNDSLPLDLSCKCHTCLNFSRAYLHHLFRNNEMTFYRLATIHNLHYYLTLMREARSAILDGKFAQFRNDFYTQRKGGLS
ncbi:MAG: tRNA guanosine(34) transglycosylase Tgt [Helicobacter sp.]|nr:tRNA guanosine(34) transglycosylase Tgt [Helicobacter sp.]